MTPEQIEEGMRLLERATPGPWRAEQNSGDVVTHDRRIAGTQNGGIFWPPDSELIAYLRNNAQSLLEAAREVDGLRKDAGRYRWLRECSSLRSDRTIHVQQTHFKAGVLTDITCPSMEVLDTAIDSAIGGQQS